MRQVRDEARWRLMTLSRSIATARANGVAERGEQAAIPVFRGRRQLFRMPLHGDHPPRGIGRLERLDDSVRCSAP